MNDYKEGYADGYGNGYDEGYKDAVEKACEWLYQRQAVDLEVSDIEKFVKEFKKAMKSQCPLWMDVDYVWYNPR